uniref:cyclic nucleotide-gated ion channel 1-like n=1 Tax=Fragaria vesca subsp. vesca TaxID=101020 RepID=UPI0005CA3C0A|nr:PREDICTED: cyclic nucleotide-gated ion channel 1-like [Fragaria vesca subsp. vesca]
MENSSQVAVTVDDLEEIAEVTSLAESSKEMKAASNPDSSLQTNLEKPAAMKVEEGSSPKWSAKEITDYDSHASLFLKWKKIFLASCVFAVLLDPLFLYIPIINHDTSCLGVDENLKITALVLRSLTDLFYIMEIALQFYRSENCSGLISKFHHRHYSLLKFLRKLFFPAVATTCRHSYILIDILAILPLPQVLILIFYSKMRGSSSLSAIKVIMNLFVLMQYFPRVLRIYLSCKELGRTHIGGTATWVKGVLNFFMYILASHVLGAVWYFFAIQRMTDCWQYACGNRIDQCDSSFGCHNNDHTVRNITYLNDLCPISTPSTSTFDFGIYAIVLQSGLPVSTNYLQKFSNCFCWGLRNLSSLGSNLQPSINTWENLFVAFISVIGLLLFIYLIGNLQTYMQLDVARIEEHRHRMKVERKLEEKSRELDLWLTKNGIPERSSKDIKSRMMKKVQLELEENRDIDFETVFSMIPLEVQDYVKDRMPLTRLKQVQSFQHLDGLVLKEICGLLQPMKYTKNELIIREDVDSLQMMLLIVEGNISIEKPNHPSSSCGAGELYGEKLLTWPSRTTFPALIPSANESVKAIGDVEALVLTAGDMLSVGFKFGFHFKKYNSLEEQLANLQTSIRVFSTQEMKKATNNFHGSQIIGKGGFGVVYKGTLPGNKVVAIKLRRYRIFELTEKFVDGMSVLSQINHENLVRLSGCWIERGSPALVYEYVNNGTLHEHIHQRNGKRPISWESRMNIAVDSARGLQYLHYSTSMPIIHGDVKTMNILVDDHFRAKVSDFDALQLEEEYTGLATIALGTPGYLDPEVLQTNRMTEKSDVYGFGVVLAELITSRRAIDRERPEGEMSLAFFFVLSAERGCLDQIVDSEIINETNFEMVEKVADLARRCLRIKGEERPTMNEVVSELEALQIIAKHPDGGKAHFSQSPKDTDYLLGSPSYV